MASISNVARATLARVIYVLVAFTVAGCAGSTSIRDSSARAGITVPENCCEVFTAGTAQNYLRVFNSDIRFGWNGSREGHDHFLEVLKADGWTPTTRETAFALAVDETYIGDFRRGVLDTAEQIAAREGGIAQRLLTMAVVGSLVTHYTNAYAGYGMATNLPAQRLSMTGVPEQKVMARGVPKRIAVLQAAAFITPLGMQVVIADYTGTVSDDALRKMAIHALLQKMKLA